MLRLFDSQFYVIPVALQNACIRVVVDTGTAAIS